jgi:hypothetical protein
MNDNIGNTTTAPTARFTQRVTVPAGTRITVGGFYCQLASDVEVVADAVTAPMIRQQIAEPVGMSEK